MHSSLQITTFSLGYFSQPKPIIGSGTYPLPVAILKSTNTNYCTNGNTVTEFD